MGRLSVFVACALPQAVEHSFLCCLASGAHALPGAAVQGIAVEVGPFFPVCGPAAAGCRGGKDVGSLVELFPAKALDGR